jgi:acetyl esterase
MEQALDRRAGQPSALERGNRARAIHQPQAKATEPLPRRWVGGSAVGGAGRSLRRKVDRAHVLVDAGREPLGRRAIGLRPCPVTHRSGGRREIARLPERGCQQPQDHRIRWIRIACVYQALSSERWIALRKRMLGGGHEPLHPICGRVGIREVDELKRSSRHCPDADREQHSSPLLDVVLFTGEVDPADRSDAPFRVRHAARVAVHDRLIWNTRAEWIVPGAILGCGPGSLLGFVGPPPGLGPRPARRRGGHLDSIARDSAPARGLGERLELVRRFVDRLEMALVLVLASGRGDIRMPALCHPAARELNITRIERRFEFEEQERLLEIQDTRHDPFTLAGDRLSRGGRGPSEYDRAVPGAPPPSAVRQRAERRLVSALARLPPGLQLRLSGKPAIEIDGDTLAPEVQLMLALMARRREPRPETLTPEQAREARRSLAGVFAGKPVSVAGVSDLVLDGTFSLRARHYAPPEAGGPHPLLIYYHGGGFTYGDLETHDGVCRILCRHAGVHVLAIDYRLAPEHPFPAAVEDARDALRWAHEHAASLGADPHRIGVGGDSAGGNLAAVVARLAARDGGPPPALQLLIYPATDFTGRRRSRGLFGEGFLLTSAEMDWYEENYLGAGSGLASDPRASPLLAEDLSGLAPAFVVTAAFDPLRDEGEEYAAALLAAGTPATVRRFPGFIHAFIAAAGVSRACRDALVEVAGVTRGMFAAAYRPTAEQSQHLAAANPSDRTL